MTRSIVIGAAVWIALLIVGAAFGALASFYTGSASELPRWNGWRYVVFCVKEGVTFTAILTWPIPLVAFLILWARQRRNA